MNDLLSVGDQTTVGFALGRASVSVIGIHKLFNGDVIYHVEDIKTGHQDYVGSQWIST